MSDNIIQLFPQKPDETESAYQELLKQMSCSRHSDEDIQRILDSVRAQMGDFEQLFSDDRVVVHIPESELGDAQKVESAISDQLGPMIGQLMQTTVYFASIADIYREEFSS